MRVEDRLRAGSGQSLVVGADGPHALAPPAFRRSGRSSSPADRPKPSNLLDRPWIEVAADGWLAYPLAIDSPGQPHLLEVEYPSDFEQTLGISLVEPNAAGQVQPIGLDSGFAVPPAAGHKPRSLAGIGCCSGRGRRTPWVLLTNRRDDRPALVGKINVLAGPSEPPALTIPPSAVTGRTLAAYLDRPLVAENFSAGEMLDPATRRVFDDWVDVLSKRASAWSPRCKHGGYNAVVLSVAQMGARSIPASCSRRRPNTTAAPSSRAARTRSARTCWS